jgi:L-ribulokinase
MHQDKMKDRFVFGIDFGTESVRAILVSLEKMEAVSTSVSYYANGIITDIMPGTNERLPSNWALQDPKDYIDSMKFAVKECLEVSGVNPEAIIGIGIDFTSSTILPIDDQGYPLCFNPKFRTNPHSWVKLWKHHAASKEASRINELANLRNEAFLDYYGGSISEEWMLPKVLQILNEAPEIYHAAHSFIEAGDWIVLYLTGRLTRSNCSAGYKALWRKDSGFPSEAFLEMLHPELKHFYNTKMCGDYITVEEKAGYLKADIAEEWGLTTRTAVAPAIIDAHSALLGTCVSQPGKLVMVMGTSLCHMCLYDEEITVKGISGVVKDGIVPGYYGYEAGQSAGGDTLAWFVRNLVSERMVSESLRENVSVYKWLENKSAKLKPGESGLIALDWWNGNRSILNNPELSGLVIGYTLSTRPEEIYRALMESLAFGSKKIFNRLDDSGIKINELYASGGLAEKNSLLMQIYADVNDKPVYVMDRENTSAWGAALLGAVAADNESGGFDSIQTAMKVMRPVVKTVFLPNQNNVKVYQALYKVYEQLYDFYGDENNSVMKKLIEIKEKQKGV